MNEEYYESLDRVMFLEHYPWGELLSCWKPDGTFCHHRLIPGYVRQ